MAFLHFLQKKVKYFCRINLCSCCERLLLFRVLLSYPASDTLCTLSGVELGRHFLKLGIQMSRGTVGFKKGFAVLWIFCKETLRTLCGCRRYGLFWFRSFQME